MTQVLVVEGPCLLLHVVSPVTHTISQKSCKSRQIMSLAVVLQRDVEH